MDEVVSRVRLLPDATGAASGELAGAVCWMPGGAAGADRGCRAEGRGIAAAARPTAGRRLGLWVTVGKTPGNQHSTTAN